MRNCDEKLRHAMYLGLLVNNQLIAEREAMLNRDAGDECACEECRCGGGDGK